MIYQQKLIFFINFLLIVFFDIFCFQAYGNQGLKELDFVVVKVNNKVIVNSEIVARKQYALWSTKIKISNSTDQKILREQIIDKMIEEQLIRIEAEKLNITLSPQEFQEAFEIIANQRKQNSAQFKLTLKKSGISFADFSKYLEAEILWSKIIKEVLVSKIKVSDIETEEFIERGKSRADNRKFYLAEIVIDHKENQERAQIFSEKLFDDLQKGANFNELVRQFSMSISSQNLGVIGWVGQGDIDAKIYQAINLLSKNSYSRPILLSDGYHIFKLLDSRVEKTIDPKEADFARNLIFQSKLKTSALGYMMDMRKKAFIEKN